MITLSHKGVYDTMDFSKHTIKKDVPIPLYYQVKQIILDELNSDGVKAGDAIPTEKAFCDIYDISRTTIRQAISELVNEGYLYRVKSKGTFVSQPKIKTDLINMYDGYNMELTNMDMIPSTQAIEITLVKANTEQSKALEIKEGDSVIYLLRHRYADGMAMGYIESYFKYPLCDFLLKESDEAFNSTSVYQILEQKKETKIKRIRKTIEAVSATEAEAKFLDIKKGSPINLCTNICYSQETGTPVIYEILKYRGDKNKFSIDINID